MEPSFVPEESGPSTAIRQEHDSSATVFHQQEQPPQQQQDSNDANGGSICIVEPTITPSASAISAAHRIGLSERAPSPMTFDQQAQTDGNFMTEMHGQQWQQEQLEWQLERHHQELLSIQVSILNEQRNYRWEMANNRFMLTDMAGKVNGVYEMFRQLTANMYGLPSVSSEVEGINDCFSCVNKFETIEVIESEQERDTESSSSHMVLEENRNREVERFVVAEQNSNTMASNAVEESLIQVDSIHVEESNNPSVQSNSSSNHVQAHAGNASGQENVSHHNQLQQHHHMDISTSTPTNLSNVSEPRTSSTPSLSNANVTSSESERPSSSGIEGPKSITGIVTGNGELLVTKVDEVDVQGRATTESTDQP